MSASQRRKGAVRERQIVNKLRAIGCYAERVPLSGAARYQGGNHDVDVYPFGRDAGALVAEVKSRKDGAGFKTLESWLNENDLLVLWRDRADPMVCMPWRVLERIFKALQR